MCQALQFEQDLQRRIPGRCFGQSAGHFQQTLSPIWAAQPHQLGGKVRIQGRVSHDPDPGSQVPCVELLVTISVVGIGNDHGWLPSRSHLGQGRSAPSTEHEGGRLQRSRDRLNILDDLQVNPTRRQLRLAPRTALMQYLDPGTGQGRLVIPYEAIQAPGSLAPTEDHQERSIRIETESSTCSCPVSSVHS